jgi:transmembrane sensor
MLVTMFLGRSREFTTQTAERHAAALADGSRVELNAQTALAVVFTKAERRVRLARGEALFTVAKDAARPFVVETPAGVVRVTGTVFNVRAAAAQRVEVTVLEGTVRVQPEHATEKTATLTADNQAVLRAENVETHTLHAGAAQDVAAWRQGQAVFEDTRLADAIERFAAYHVRRIAVDAAAADLRLGGRFSLDDLDGWLDFVQRVLPVRVARVDGAVVISPAPAK